MKIEELKSKRRPSFGTCSAEKRRREKDDRKIIGEESRWKKARLRLMVENDDCREIADETDDRMKNETHPVQARQKAEQGENGTISLEIDRLTWVDIAVSTN